MTLSKNMTPSHRPDPNDKPNRNNFQKAVCGEVKWFWPTNPLAAWKDAEHKCEGCQKGAK